MPARRDPNIKASPKAWEWVRNHPDAGRNVLRVVRFMSDRYSGDNEGYINRAQQLVEYRFAPVDDEPLFWEAHIIGRQKHTTVRFYLYKAVYKGPWRTRVLKGAKGQNLSVIDISVVAGQSLEKLKLYLHSLRSFSKGVTAVEARQDRGFFSSEGLEKLGYHRFNIGRTASTENINTWWTENVDRGFITGFKGKSGDRGGKHLNALHAGDWVLAYASGKGYIGAGRVLAENTYTLHRAVPPNSNAEHKHSRGIKWLYVIRNVADAITEDDAGLYHPLSTRQRGSKKNIGRAERLLYLLSRRGEHLSKREANPPTILASDISAALKSAEEVEARQPPIDTENDARTRDMRAVVRRRGQRQFRDSLLRAYGRRCAVTGCTAIAVLEAAHIIPFFGDHTNRIDNGLLLRSDIHTIFDLGLLWIDADTMEIQVSDELLVTEYGEYHGRPLKLPRKGVDAPLYDHLRNHALTACGMR